MRSRLRRWFQKGRIPVPDPFDLPDKYLMTERGRYADPGSEYRNERWLLCSNREEKVLAFCSDLDINVISQSSALIMDGTFKA
uniref:Uncharacterized protein n=1 Tax=Romanomermis culicivorax TaxID=13658 RepID=A0A915JEX1_ROMCU